MNHKGASSYHNTTKESGQLLMTFEQSAQTQDELVLWIFKYENRPLAWPEVMAYMPANTCEGSVKRGITNNKNAGHLEVTDQKILSHYNRPCFRYKLKTI